MELNGDEVLGKADFPYRLQTGQTWAMLLLILVFSGLCFFMSYSRLANSPSHPLEFAIWGLGAVGTVALALLLFNAWKTQRHSGRAIHLGSDGLELPRTILTRKQIFIRYSDIDAVLLEKAPRGGFQSIRIRHSGKSTNVYEIGFSSKSEYLKFYMSVLKHKNLTCAIEE
ncbi:hypothetical protein [uncultured Cohaesibacter sp.]|uniref:hypothetical protein n=1 Tax=uncultured Cohaesibacter sp. TaxID=1002546 RepID=UPI0029C61C16|nr:hypothetical protein [uncultured Cohaesibacter sp.]